MDMKHDSYIGLAKDIPKERWVNMLAEQSLITTLFLILISRDDLTTLRDRKGI